MITKKKLKTKFDYQIRTFGLCALLLFAFTMLFITPKTQELKDNNTSIQSEIKVQEDKNDRLKFENAEMMIESTVKNND